VRTVHIDLTEDGFLVQAIEYVPGLSLEKWLQSNGPIAAPMVARIGAMLVGALAEAHAKGVIHRSVSPSNVLLSTFSPGVRLLGFGTVRPVQRGTGAQTVLSGISPEFVAPEYLQESADIGPIDGRADVYSLGLLLCYAMSGRSPYNPTTGAGWLKAHMTETPMPLESLTKNVSPALCALVNRCLAKDMTRRPAASERSEQLDRLANESNGDGADAFVRDYESDARGKRISIGR
jgi:serine/threonine-protein kinase